MDESIRDNQSSSVTSDLSGRSSQSARRVKRLSSKAGEAIDPLLSAVPFEVPVYQEATTSLEKPGKRSYTGMLSDTLQPFVCCGMHPVN
eukprot:scaffold10954_cov74-Cyclotella_meneghiniana.AAC.13